MSHDHEMRPIPKGILYAAGGLVVASLGLATLAQTTGFGKMTVPKAEALSRAEVRFEDHGEDGVAVLDARSGHLVATLESGGDGFVRGVLRSLNRQRRLDQLSTGAPFVLTRWADGRLSLADPTTGEEVQLVGFGEDNFAAFDALAEAASGDAP